VTRSEFGDDRESRPHLTADDIRHILDGESAGSSKGGHRWGSNTGKTEFPLLWRDDAIIGAVEAVIAGGRVRVGGDRRVVRAEIDGLIIEASWYVDERRRMVFRTAYPINGHGVTRHVRGDRIARLLDRSVLEGYGWKHGTHT